MSSRKTLPPEIIEAILRRLPAKSLGRFKSVSKPWRSLISNPEFIKTHHKTSKLLLVSDMKSLFSVNINELLPYLTTAAADKCTTGKEITFRPPPSIRWEQILGSCNGLVLIKDEDDTIFLINPTTLEVSKLPVNPFALPFGESFVMYGFGYDSFTDDYKVVSISFWDTDNEHNPDCIDMFISVYSLMKNSWRKVDNSPYDHAVGHLVSGVLINENLHWLTQRIPSYSSTIVAFSLANEEFNEIELPDSIDNKKGVFNELVVLGGKLAIFGNQLGKDLWVMEEYDDCESWIRVFIDGIEIDPVKPLCSLDGSDREIVLGDEDGVLIVYNLDEKRCRNVRVLGGPSALVDVGGMYMYHESLVSPIFITRTP